MQLRFMTTCNYQFVIRPVLIIEYYVCIRVLPVFRSDLCEIDVLLMMRKLVHATAISLCNNLCNTIIHCRLVSFLPNDPRDVNLTWDINMNRLSLQLILWFFQNCVILSVVLFFTEIFAIINHEKSIGMAKIDI